MKVKISMKNSSIVPSIKIILIYKNKVLLLSEGDSFDLPGGRMEYGEGIFDTLQREIKEELGLNLKFTSEPVLIRVYDYLYPKDKVQRVYVVYAYEIKKELVNLPNNVQWYSFSDIDSLQQNEQWKQMILKAKELLT